MNKLHDALARLAVKAGMPIVVLYAAAGFIVLILCASVFGALFGNGTPTQSVASASPVGTATSTRPTSILNKATAVAAAPAAVTSAPSSAGANLTNVMLPALPAPAGVQRGYCKRVISAPAGGDTWTQIGSVIEKDSLVDFKARPPASLLNFVPSTATTSTYNFGQTVLREEWNCDIQVPVTGVYTAIIQESGRRWAKASVRFDGQDAAVATASDNYGQPAEPRPPTDQYAGTGQVSLQQGFHQVSIRLDVEALTWVTPESSMWDASPSLYLRGPNDSAPIAVAAFGVPPAK